MPKSGEVGSPKWISIQLKKKGLDKLKFYCQSCQKQCRDANGFKLHVASPSHLANQQKHSQDNSVAKWSQQFESDFIHVLKSFPRDSPTTANRVYNELIRDKAHIHLNATRWRSLSAFVNYLNQKKTVIVHATEPEIVISFRDLGKEEARQRHEMESQLKLDRERNLQQEMLDAQIRHSKDTTEASEVRAENQNDINASTGNDNNDNDESKKSEANPNKSKISFSLKKKKK